MAVYVYSPRMHPQDVTVLKREVSLIPGKSIELSDDEFKALPASVAQFLHQLPEHKARKAPKPKKKNKGKSKAKEESTDSGTDSDPFPRP